MVLHYLSQPFLPGYNNWPSLRLKSRLLCHISHLLPSSSLLPCSNPCVPAIHITCPPLAHLHTCSHFLISLAVHIFTHSHSHVLLSSPVFWVSATFPASCWIILPSLPTLPGNDLCLLSTSKADISFYRPGL